MSCCLPPLGLWQKPQSNGDAKNKKIIELNTALISPDVPNSGDAIRSMLSSPSSLKSPKRKMSHVFLQKPAVGKLTLVGAPLCDGQPLGGVDLAPDAMRRGGLQAVIENEGWEFADGGDVPRPDSDLEKPKVLAKSLQVANPDEYFSEELVMNSVVVGHSVSRVYDYVSAAKQDGSFVLTVGGDHSIAAGSIAGVMKHRPDTAVIWIDAHGDCNTPDSSPSGHYHGMPLAHLLGWFDHRVRGFKWLEDHVENHGEVPEDRVALIGLRDVDPAEAQMLKNSGVHVFTMREVDRHGIGAVMEDALKKVDPRGERPLHLSFDIDACDPSVAPGTGTCSRGGLSYREAHYICDRLAETHRLGSMDIVEVNPALDVKSDETLHGDDPLISGTQTVRLGIELVATALGKKLV